MDFNQNPSLIAVLVFLVIGLFKVVNWLIRRVFNNRPVLSIREHEWLRFLYEMHNKNDENGIPLWYIPRDILKHQLEILKI